MWGNDDHWGEKWYVSYFIRQRQAENLVSHPSVGEFIDCITALFAVTHMCVKLDLAYVLSDSPSELLN